jgi:hypothetical protein
VELTRTEKSLHTEKVKGMTTGNCAGLFHQAEVNGTAEARIVLRIAHFNQRFLPRTAYFWLYRDRVNFLVGLRFDFDFDRLERLFL